MADLEDLRGRIPSYAGYATGDDRQLADQQLRAWVGERLAVLDGRLGLAEGDLAVPFDALLRACEFGDPALMLTLEKREFDAAEFVEMYHVDLDIVDLAQRSESLERSGVAAFLDGLERLFAQRALLIVGEPEAKSA